MAKKRIKVKYSKLTLPQIIECKAKKKCSFLELKLEGKKVVLNYIINHHSDIHVFGQKWFDIITNKFYVDEYKTDKESFNQVNVKTHSFKNFSEFYEFLNGDIYRDSCFYGYNFSREEKERYSLEFEKINFDSFISETIDNYSFEDLQEPYSEGKKINAEEMLKWLKECKQINSCDELLKKLDLFKRKFTNDAAKNIFFSYIIRTQKDTIRDSLIEFVCKNDTNQGVSFDDILVNYGRNYAIKVIENYHGDCGPSTTRKKIRNFKNSLEGYDSGTFQLDRRIEYNNECQMYVVKEKYYNNKNYALNIENYFDSLTELALYVNGDFRHANFSNAPILDKDLEKYKTDASTKFPLKKNFANYIVKKIFFNNEFHVNQVWLDSKNMEIKKEKHSFKKFFDFVHFLKNDLSEADLLMCEGIENIKPLNNLNIQNIKVRSNVASILNVSKRIIPEGMLITKDFSESANFELQTVESFELQRADDYDYLNRVSYITDIHLLHRFDACKCQTYEDINYMIRALTNTLGEQSTLVNLIAGDTSSDFKVFKDFINNLSNISKGRTFFVLGNHELWDSSFKGMTLEEVVEEYKKLETSKINLVHNNLYYLVNFEWRMLSTDVLMSISSDELRSKMRSSRLIIFGGIGFAGKNEKFNANSGLYLSILNRDEEIKESKKFFELYEKVTESLKGMNLIILTHMPMRDWGGDVQAKEGVIYVNGHNHKNYFYDDGKKRIYADNQVGYKGKKVFYKTIPINFEYNWFADYKDGIYEITKDDYKRFYRGINEWLTFNREFANLYMIKREGNYMFLIRTLKGSLQILNGGSIRKAGNHELEYFYENIVKYSKSVSMFLSKYAAFQKQISSEVKQIGGNGNIHGSIVDIDFYNHLYINPLNGSVTPYFAISMVDKYVYDNVPSLLKYECPQLFTNYEKLIAENASSNALVLYNQRLPIIKKKTYNDSTEMYKISRIIKGLQFTTKYNIVRLWNDNFVSKSSEENGRLIVSSIIDHDSISQVDEVKKRF